MKDIWWGGDDPFTHMLICGPTRCGKTSAIIKPMIKQLLEQKASGIPLGLTVIEPKGDLAQYVADLSRELALDCHHVSPKIPNSAVFNVMEGDSEDIAEATRAVLSSMFGKQEAFFAHVQELASKNVTLVLKELYGDNLDLIDVLRTLRNPEELRSLVYELERRQGETDLVQSMKYELFGKYKDEYHKYATGLRVQLESITGSQRLKRIITGRSSFKLDPHVREGGIVAIDTDMGKLKKVGDAFGTFALMHVQSAVLRRVDDGLSERERVPHYLVVDELSRYINPDMELFLSIAAELRCAQISAIQSFSQLEVQTGKLSAAALRNAILQSKRNVIAFGGLKSEDAKYMQELCGQDEVLTRQNTYSQHLMIPDVLPEKFREVKKMEYRIPYTTFIDGLPRFHFVASLVQNGTPMRPIVGKAMLERASPMMVFRRYLNAGNNYIKKMKLSLKKQNKLENAIDNIMTVNAPSIEEEPPRMQIIFPEEELPRNNSVFVAAERAKNTNETQSTDGFWE